MRTRASKSRRTPEPEGEEALLFHSPTKGPLSFAQVFADIVSWVQASPEDRFRLIIGTDSQYTEGRTCFVTAVIIHREGKGARYYYRREYEPVGASLRQRIYLETSRSLRVAGLLAERLALNGHADLNLEIHLDIGEHGETKELIREVVGMVVGSGFDARIKPESYGASSVADKYTK